MIVLATMLAYDIQFACDGHHLTKLVKRTTVARLFSAARGPLAILILLFGAWPVSGMQQASSQWPLKPYRVLLVVDKWEDTTSQLITSEQDSFQPVAALLKAWSVPFEILRLDQQILGNSRLFERTGTVRYGTVLWLADSSSYATKNVAALEEAAKGGTSVLVLASRCLDPALERILGLGFKEPYSSTSPLEIGAAHFITEGLHQRTSSGEFDSRLSLESRTSQVLISQQKYPVLAVRQVDENTSAIWMGVPHLKDVIGSSYWRGLLFRSLVWSLGYLVTPDADYSHQFVLALDDWGTADKGFLSYWRYPTLSEAVVREHLIEPLAKHRAVMAANVVTGYVDRSMKRILVPWTQKFTDRYGVLQDYGSTKRGLLAAVAAGVVEIESHGWTHMQPDLDSPPGPWWNADLDGEGSTIGWYEEFLDRRRGGEAPALTQLFHLKRSLEYLSEDFGSRALSIRAGGAAWSRSYSNHTGRIAAQAGFGLFEAGTEFNFYLDRDMVLDMAGAITGASHGHEQSLNAQNWPAHPDGPIMVTAHDRDIALQPDFLDRLFEQLPPAYETLSMNQYIAVLHTEIESTAGNDWRLAFHFEEPYCDYFKKHSSSWKLWLAGGFQQQLKSAPFLDVSVDEATGVRVQTSEVLRQPLRIEIPSGAGTHIWKLSAAK